MLQFISEHPYIFGVTLAVMGVYALVHVLFFRTMGTDYTASLDEDE